MKNLKPEEDAYGQLVWAYYNGNEVYEIAERDDGYISASPLPKIYFSSYDEWSSSEKKAMEYVKGRVLDVGCGAGRHSLFLQEKGFDVLGIDLSPLSEKVCKLRGLRKVQVMSIEEVNFKPDSFDTILMMGNNFGLFGSFKKAQRLLKKFHKMTSKTALIIAVTNDVYKTDNPAHLDYQKTNREKGRMSGQVKLRIRYQKYATPWFDYLMVSKEEMQTILKGTRWHVKQFLDSEESNYIAIIEKNNYSETKSESNIFLSKYL